MWVMENTGRFGGIVLIAAGLYQLSPLKHLCLAKCRSPLAFIRTSWRNGYGGAFRMGLDHGIYCLGCCWLLFVIFFPLGMMNVAAMAAITVLIFAEKSLSLGHRISQIGALALIVYGLVAVFVPEVLPTMLRQGPCACSYRSRHPRLNTSRGHPKNGAKLPRMS
jgi:predicted metal-binding membrane protein